ncbi:MAG: sensor histidine kinase [Burkholderiales bacterium]|jgi:PAS domain S-box-containing protein|nr:sensor histidine kinase [Burkholderiales bacterium]
MINQFNFEDENNYKLIDAIGASIYWKDKEGHILGCNKYMLKMAGLKDRAKIIGKTDYELCWKNYADEIRAADISVMKTGSYTGEERVNFPNGEQRIYFSTKTQLRDAKGNVIGIAGVSFDITDQKKFVEQEKQQAVNNEQMKIMQIIDVVNASIYWKDKSGHILGCNKYMVDMFGAKDRRELIGKTDYDLYPPEIAGTISKMDTLVMKDGPHESEEQVIFNDEERIYLSAKNRLLDNYGKVIGIVGTSIDITAQKKANQLQLEKETYLAEKNAQKELIKFVDAMQQMMNEFRIKTINEKTGTKLEINDLDKNITLTNRESQTLYYLSLNKSPKDIAAILSIIENKKFAPATIQAVINKQLYPKFGVYNIGQLLEKASMLKLIPFLPGDFNSK